MAKQRGLVNVSLAMLFAFATQTMVVTLMPIMAVGLEASTVLIGILGSLVALLPLISSMYVGLAVDRRGYKRPLLLGVLALAVTPVAMIVVPTLWTLAAIQVMVGFFHLVAVIASQAFVARLDNGMSHESRFGMFTLFVSIGQLVGPVFAGVLTDALGFGAAFGGAGMLALIGFLLARNTPDGRDQEEAQPSLPSMGEALAVVRRAPGAGGAIAASATIILMITLFQVYLPVRLRELEYSATIIGGLISARAAASLVIRPVMPRLVVILGGHARALLFMVVVAGLAVSTMGVAVGTVLLAGACIALGVAHGVVLPLSMVATVEHVPSAMRGIALGLRLTGNYVAQFFGPLLLGLVASLVGVGATLAAGAVLVAPTAIVIGQRARKILGLVDEGGSR